jgi:dihydroflavonol-4-reductase
MVLAIEEAPDDYYRSKIETDAVIFAFLDRHPDMHISLVLPGWMHGPGDLGPTSAGQFVEDYLQQKIPGVVDAAFSVVDARDVAQVALASSKTGNGASAIWLRATSSAWPACCRPWKLSVA